MRKTAYKVYQTLAINFFDSFFPRAGLLGTDGWAFIRGALDMELIHKLQQQARIIKNVRFTFALTLTHVSSMNQMKDSNSISARN